MGRLTVDRMEWKLDEKKGLSWEKMTVVMMDLHLAVDLVGMMDDY
jgi:hypothetical protein